MSAGIFDRLSPTKGGAGDASSPQTPGERATASGSSPQVLTNAPQPLKIVRDVLECIETLKANFEEEGSPVDDNNQTLHRFCAKLEFLLQFDMKERKSITGRKKDYWDYFCNCIESVKGVNDGIKYVKTVGDCKTSLGKGRAFLRFCLMHHRLADSLQQCVTNGKATSVWYGPNSIWLQHEKSSGIISALYDLNDVVFDLAPRGYDLDTAWPSFARMDTFESTLCKHPFVTIRSRKNMEGQQSWALSERSRASSISSLNSIGQEVYSPNKSNLSVPADTSELEHLTQELAISENVRSDLADRMEALEQQKSIFQQSIAESRGEMNMLETQHKQLQSEHKELQNSYRELEKKFDKLTIESDLKEKDSKMFVTAAEDKLQKSVEENESWKEKVACLEEDVHIAKENLQVTMTERDSLTNKLEKMKQDKENVSRDFEDKKVELEERLHHLESERDELLGKLRTVEDEKIVQSGNTVEIQKLLEEKVGIIEGLEKRVEAMKNGFIWLQRIKENHTYTEISDLDTMAANILKDLSKFVQDIMKQKAVAEEETECLSLEKDSLKEKTLSFELEINESRKEKELLETALEEVKKIEKNMKQKIADLQESLQLQSDKLNLVTEELIEKDKMIADKDRSIITLTAEKSHMAQEIEAKEKDFLSLKEDVKKTQNELQKTSEYYNLATKGQSDLMEKMNSQEKQIVEKDKKLFDMMEKEKLLSDTKITLQREVDILKSKVCDLERELILVNEAKDSCQKELEEKKLQIEESAIRQKESDKKFSQQQKKISKLEKQKFDLKDVLSEMENDKDALKKEMDSKRAEVKEIQASLGSENEKLTSDINSYKAQLVHLESELTLFKTKITGLEEQNAVQTQSEKMLTEKVNSLEIEINSKSFSIISCEKEIETLSKENSQAKIEKENLLEQMKLQQNQLFEKQSEVLLLKEKLERSQDDLQRTKEFYEAAAKTESDLSERFRSLEDSLREKDNRISELNESEKGLTVELTKLNRDNVDLQEKVHNLKQNMEKLSYNNTESHSQIENLQSSINDIKLEKAHLRMQIDEHMIKEKCYEEAENAQRIELEKLSVEKGDLQQEIETGKLMELKQSEYIKEQGQRILELEQKKIQTEKYLEQMKEDFDIVTKEKENLIEKIEDLEDKTASNDKDIDSLNTECNKLISLKDEMLMKFSDSEQRNRDLCNTIEKLKVDYDMVSNDKYDLEEKLDIYEKELQVSKTSITSLTTELSAFKDLKEENQNRLESFELKEIETSAAIETLKKQNTSLQKEHEVLNGNIQELNLLNSEKMKEIDCLQSDFLELKNEKQAKEKELNKMYQCDAEKSDLIISLREDISCLNGKKCDLEVEVNRCQTEKATIVANLERTSLELKSATIDKNEIGQNLAISTEINKDLSKTIDDLKSKYAQLKGEHSFLQASNDEEKSCSEKLRVESSEMLTKLELLQQELAQSYSKCQAVEENGRILLEENEKLEAEKADLTASLSGIKEKYEEIKATIGDSFSRLSQILYDSLGYSVNEEDGLLSQEVPDSLAKVIEMLEATCVSKVSSMQELQNSLDIKSSENGKLSEQIKSHELKEEGFKREIDSQNLALQEAEKVELKLQQTFTEVEKLTEAMTNLVTEKEVLSQNLETETKRYQGLIEELERDNEQIKLSILSEKKETEILKKKGSENEHVINSLHNDFEIVQSEKHALEKDILDMKCNMQAECDQLNKEKRNLLQEFSIVKQKLEESELSLKENHCVTDDQRASILKLTENVRSLQDNLTESQENCASAKQSLEMFKGDKEKQEKELKQTLTVLETKQCELSDQLKETLLSLQSVTQQLGVKTLELDTICKEKETLEQKHAEMTMINEDLASQIETWKLKDDENRKEMEMIKKDLEFSAHKLTDTETRLQQLTDEHTHLCDKYELTVKSHEEFKQNAEDQVSTVLLESKSNVETLRKENDEMVQNIEQLNSEMEDVSKKVSSLEEKLNEKESIISETNTKFIEINEKYEDKCQMNDQLNMKLEEKDNTISELQKELDNFTDKFTTCQLEIEAFDKDMKEKNEKLEQLELLQMDKDKLVKEIELLEAKNSEIIINLDQQTQKCDSLKESFDIMMANLTETDEELETVRKSKDTEVESLKQEITALEFQLSAEQLQNEEKQKAVSIDESEFTEMKDKLMEQETIIEDLQSEMENLRIISVQHKEQTQQIDSLEDQLGDKERRNKELEEKLQQMEANLAKELESSQKVKHNLTDEKQKVEEIIQEKDREIEELREDLDQLKKKLVKLIKEKDSLWQKTDRLAHQHRLHMTEKWMDGSTVTNCLGCNSEFSFTLRKHHCRLCGRIFCYNCSSHWVMTASSSKKLRACTACYIQYSSPMEESQFNSELDEQSVEIPKRHFIGTTGSLHDTSTISIASSTASISDTEELYQDPVGDTLGTSDVKFITGNETDEDKLKDSAEQGEEIEGEDKFHVISDEEIQRSLTMSAEFECAAQPDPNMTCSSYLSLEDLENGDINSQSEVWIKPGMSFAIPIQISQSSTVFGWEFTSYPKDVVFSATYRQTQGVPYKDGQILVPPCKCDSHKEATRGELTAKQPGIYTLIFDNTYSKMTSKRVNYSLFSSKSTTAS